MITIKNLLLLSNNVARRGIATLISSLLLIASTSELALATDIFTHPSVDHVPQLIRSFEDPNLRFGASKAIVSIGKPAVPLLTESLSDRCLDIRIWSAYTLGEIGPDASPAGLALSKCLKSEDNQLRAVAARSLGRIGSDDATVIELLSHSVSDEDARVSRLAVVSLGKIGPAAIAAAPRLVDAFGEQSIRAEAIDALILIGKGALPSLTEALANNDIRLEAIEAIRQIDAETAKQLGIDKPTSDDLPALQISLHDVDKDVEARIAAAESLSGLGLDAAPTLISALADNDDRVVQASASAVGTIGAAAVPLLRESFRHESARVRAATLDALAAIGPDASDAIDDLIEALQDTDREVRYRAVKALDQWGTSAQPAIPGLISVMQNAREQEATRQWAIKALGRIAPPGHEQTIAALEESTKDSNYGVKSLAQEILRQLQASVSEG